MKPCIGLFGTCGGSKWRYDFIKEYNKLGLNYFNPQVEDWVEELAEIEAGHLVNDEIVLFPITGETYGTGSLAETGYSALQAININSHRDFVIMIEQKIDSELDDPIARKESLRSRALVTEHLKKLNIASLYVVESLSEMLELSIALYDIATKRKTLEKFRIK